MLLTWDSLSDEQQVLLAREALRRAADSIAGQAECLAGEIESGVLLDRGGPDALRLLAALVRAASGDPSVTPAAA